jgi:hypothetical protein
MGLDGQPKGWHHKGAFVTTGFQANSTLIGRN